MLMDPLFDYQFRLILIGDSTVGKSSLLRYFCDGKFNEVTDATVGVDFFARLVEIKNGIRIKLQLWDTAGQERFRSITKSYYRNSVGAILAFDVTSRESFEKIPLWMNEAKKHIESIGVTPEFLLVGCKSDLTSTREIRTEEAEHFANSLGIPYLETSAKTGSNVQDAFITITQNIYDRIGEFKLNDEWDGIKVGFFKNSPHLLEAQPESSKCCF